MLFDGKKLWTIYISEDKDRDAIMELVSHYDEEVSSIQETEYQEVPYLFGSIKIKTVVIVCTKRVYDKIVTAINGRKIKYGFSF